jgi:hypothetical protein
VGKRPQRRSAPSRCCAKAEHLGGDCWRVTLPGGRTLPVRGTVWRLITAEALAAANTSCIRVQRLRAHT